VGTNKATRETATALTGVVGGVLRFRCRPGLAQTVHRWVAVPGRQSAV